jgi:two-component system sensor histidine kinase ChvG
MTEKEPLLVERGARRWSLRLRVVGAIVIVALAPQLLVFAWSQLDRPVPSRLWMQARDAAREAVELTARGAANTELSGVAKRQRVRLRVFDEAGEAVFFADDDAPGEPFGRVESFFLGAPQTMTLDEIDEELGPVPLRPETIQAKKTGFYVACQWESLVYCQAIAAARDAQGNAHLVYVQVSSRRAVAAVYDLRRQLMRIGLLTVPLALILAIYTGRRLVRPIERLRRQALARAAEASRGVGLDPEARDEVGALADAFNALLVALEKKRTENEAFVADLVHEFKNPIAAMRACADALGSGLADGERTERLARVLFDSSGKLDGLVTHFLELARAEAGMPNEERTRIDLAPLARGVVERARDDARYGDVRFSFAQSGDEGARVFGVVHRLDALVRELVENGASFVQAGGAVEVSVRVQPNELVITVADTGPGIADDAIPKVFDRFYTTRGEKRGTGLGLSLVRAVAEAHGGSVAATSKKGEGATFEVRLPRAR